MEVDIPYYTNIAFKAATAASGHGLQVHLSLDEEAFKGAHGEAALADFKLDKVYRFQKDGTRFSVLKIEGEFKQPNIADVAGRIHAEATRAKATSYDLVLPEGVCVVGFAKFAYCLNIANYRYDLREEKLRKTVVAHVTLVHSKAEEYSKDSNWQFYLQAAESKNLARDYLNRRPNLANVQYFVHEAKRVQAQHSDKVQLRVFHGEKELTAEGLRLLWAVGKGSTGQPALVNLSYKGNPDSDEYTAIVGKGIVYDQGGVNVKTALTAWMWTDKGGACAVFAAFQGIVKLGLKVNVTATLALAENLLSGHCYRTSDIITSYKGLTVEILNTDAEGRLVLADAMSWTQKNYKVGTLFDIATLTGAAIVALGLNYAPVMGNNKELEETVVSLAGEAYEQFWRFPIDEKIAESMKSQVADLRNINESQWGGCIAGGAFLRYFVEPGVKFAHLDIAGPSKVDAAAGMYSVGATGIGAGFFLNYFRHLSSQ